MGLHRRRKKQSGFTLIELLVVIAIIGLLAGGIMLALASARIKARDSKRVADMKQAVTALDEYYVKCNSYPVVLGSIVLDNAVGLATGTETDCGDNSGTATNGGIGSTTGEVFIGRFVSAPTPPDGDCSTLGGGGGDGNPYTYSSFSDAENNNPSIAGDTRAGSFALSFCLGNNTGSYSAGMHTITPGGVQ